MRRTNKERTESMRLMLMAAARTLFVAKGYTETATPEIASAAGVTRGALYHHFEDKKALFAAVVAEEARQVGAGIAAGSENTSNARDALLDGARGYFDAMAVPGRTRLLLLDGPAILGLRSLQDIDQEHAEGSLKAGLSDLFAAGGKDLALLDVFTQLLSAAFDRAALAIEAGAQRKDYESAIAALIDGIAVK
ncbi:TetR/AcrR family transcriptional regulator [Rhizobium sp. Root483D2]|uniref:TetR/AcrR family transcriptional regulator n=1 Tax=Rhizobium sp. Root483D2 TaxID=1736545 RepID=UPI000715F584|nr:TetR/AcrR family transcriptional regulator [Rhizobium sp. Root483D2]KQY40481.1 TetR family transcriptional regulator [Rhizobium sp. Root483D2]